jgi:hypothetical protein
VDRQQYNQDCLSSVLIVSSLVVVIYVGSMSHVLFQATSDKSDIWTKRAPLSLAPISGDK